MKNAGIISQTPYNADYKYIHYHTQAGVLERNMAKKRNY